MTDVGVIGLGVMGRNIVLNLVDKGYTVHVYNRTYFKTVDLEKQSENIHGHKELDTFMYALSEPRKIIMMLSAGNAIDMVLRDMCQLLDEGDVVVDGGNSNYVDTIRRCGEYKFNYVGCGISGGEYGARNGASMMPGCKKEAYGTIKKVLEDISCKKDGKPCCGWLGENGAGHFVKIVHNGIEYCEMELLQEIFNATVNSFGTRESFDAKKLEFTKEMLKEWNDSELGGYLVEICIKIMNKKDNGVYVVNEIIDKAEQKGTGKMCINASVELNVEVSAMANAVMARFLSHNKEKRLGFVKRIGKEEKKAFSGTGDDLKKAFYLCKTISYVQGFNLLLAAKKEHGWDYTIEQVCDIWGDGCILRCDVLSKFKEHFDEEPLEFSAFFVQVYKENIGALKRLCKDFIDCDVYSPVFSGCLSWLNGLKMNEGNGSLIQAMRDYFGRHGVILKGKEAVNINWCE